MCSPLAVGRLAVQHRRRQPTIPSNNNMETKSQTLPKHLLVHAVKVDDPKRAALEEVVKPSSSAPVYIDHDLNSIRWETFPMNMGDTIR